jgi:hypothetical protein
MKRLESIKLDFDRCWDELAAFSDLLDRHESGNLEEQRHILPFFRKHRNIAALIGHLLRWVTARSWIGSGSSTTWSGRIRCGIASKMRGRFATTASS